MQASPSSNIPKTGIILSHNPLRCYETKDDDYNDSNQSDRGIMESYKAHDRLEIIGGKYCNDINKHCTFVKLSGEDVMLYFKLDSSGEQVRVMRKNVRRSSEKEGKRMRQDAALDVKETDVNLIIEELKGLKLENIEGKKQNELLLSEVAALHAKIDKITSAFYILNKEQ